MDEKAFTWERLGGSQTEETHRARVPGGWIYRQQWFGAGMVLQGCTMVFVPDVYAGVHE